ncbi:MAG: MotA/TolQ/ExbB proton channel family protein [Gemmataceae bacterium]|nr:MotA/TolQ/ExbB proton channel family protein [Gemmataceae bacterium]
MTRPHPTVAAFVLGLPLAAGILCLIHFGPFRETAVRRYVGHPVEGVEVLMFSIALGALAAKLWGYRQERRACRRTILPAWDGQAVSTTQASPLLAKLKQLPRDVQGTWIVKRATAVLDFLRSRGSAAELDDQLRALADNDALALEGSYALTRFICWAIPILGFLGTVVGITGAISGVTPEVLEQSLSTVTDGLALAFDTTALALGLTMVLMFLSFLVERVEQGVLETVDRYAEQELAHRFERTGAESSEFVEVVRRNTDVLLRATEQLVQQQADVWAQTLVEVDRRRAEAEERQQRLLTVSLEAALERTLETHARQLTALEKQTVEHCTALVGRLESLAVAVHQAGREQQHGLAQIAQSLAGQMETLEALARLQEGEKQLVQLQAALNQNLAALAGAGTFDEAVQSLTAAIHLLTARTTAAATGSGSGRQTPRSGAAA